MKDHKLMDLKLGPYKVEVMEVDEVPYPKGYDPGPDETLYGTACPFKQRINIRRGQGPDAHANTLLHEAMHILSDVYAIGLSEAQVNAVATAVQMLMRDNPRVVPYILGQDGPANRADAQHKRRS